MEKPEQTLGATNTTLQFQSCSLTSFFLCPGRIDFNFFLKDRTSSTILFSVVGKFRVTS